MILIVCHQVTVTEIAGFFRSALILIGIILEEISMAKEENLKIIEDMVMGI